MADEIIRELWKIKDGIANEYACDLKVFVAHLRARERKSDQSVVDLRSIKQNAENAQAARRQPGTP